jgi:hypothetical protein
MRNRSQEVYNKGIEATNPQESADIGGLEQARTNAFESINTGANRRGMFFSGIPLAEQSKYVGENYLPAVASLKNRYAGIRSNLYQTLADQLGQYDLDQQKFGREIYNTEVAQDLERESIAAANRAAAAGSAGASFGGGSFGGGTQQPAAAAQQASLRQVWQQEANAGDANAKVALKYAGDDGRYDGVVSTQAEYDALKRLGIQGGYYVKKSTQSPSGTPSTFTQSASKSKPGIYQQLVNAFGG